MIKHHHILLLFMQMLAVSNLSAMQWLTAVFSSASEPIIKHSATVVLAKVLQVTPDCPYNQEACSRAAQIKSMIDSALEPQQEHSYKPLQDLINLINKKDCLIRNIINDLNECQCIRYNRAVQPEVRGRFEEKLVQYLKSKIEPNLQQQLVCSFIGSGSLFSTMVKITKFMQHGYHNLHIVLVDKTYAQYLGQGPNMFAIRSIIEIQFKQWLSYLCKYHYPDAQIEIIVYQDMYHYFEDCGTDQNKKADLMVIEDLDLSEGHETIICPSYDHALRTGGIYAFLADEIKDITSKGFGESLPKEYVEKCLNKEIYLDSLFGFEREQNGLSNIGKRGNHFLIALTRQYIGIKNTLGKTNNL